MWGDKPIFPYYNDDNDYNTNAPSFYDYLAKNRHLLKELVNKIWEYDKELAKRFEEWDGRIESFPDDVKNLLIEWLNNGTLEQIINNDVLGNKADKSDLDITNAQLALKADNSQIIDFQNQVDNIIADTGTPDSVGGELSQLRSDTFGNNFKTTKGRVDNIENVIKDNETIIETNWEQGLIGSDGIESTVHDFIRTKDFLPVLESKVLSVNIESGYTFRIAHYDSSYKFLKATVFYSELRSIYLEGSFYKVTVRRLDTLDFTPEESHKITLKSPLNYYDKPNTINDKLYNIASNKLDITKAFYVHGAIEQDGNVNDLNDYYRTVDKYFLPNNSIIEINVIAGQRARVHFFESDGTPVSVTSWGRDTFRETMTGSYFQVVVLDNEVRPARVGGLKIYRVLPSSSGNSSASVLVGKTLLNLGDSIAAASTSGIDGYQQQLSDTFDMPLQSYALDGAFVTGGVGHHNIQQQVQKAIDDGVEPDYILLNGLTNDATAELTPEFLGTISNGYSESLDRNTFCGAFEWILKTLRKQWKKAKIVYVRPHNMRSRDERQVTLGNLATDMCKKWAIDYADVYHKGGVVIKNQEDVDYYCIPNDSGSHPNTLFYKMAYTPLIKQKLENS